MIKLHQKYFIESILYDKVSPDEIRQNRNCYYNIDGMENNLTRFQIYFETELACKHKTRLHKTHYSETLVEYKKSFDIKAGKIVSNPYPLYDKKVTKSHTSH